MVNCQPNIDMVFPVAQPMEVQRKVQIGIRVVRHPTASPPGAGRSAITGWSGVLYPSEGEGGVFKLDLIGIRYSFGNPTVDRLLFAFLCLADNDTSKN